MVLEEKTDRKNIYANALLRPLRRYWEYTGSFFILCLPACYVTVNQLQGNVNMIILYLIIKLFILKSQGYFK